MAAMTNAEKQRAKRLRKKQRLAELGEEVIHLPFPAGTRAALAELMAWHSFEDQREALATAIHRLHEAGREASAPFFAVSRHEITISDKVSRQLDEFAASRPTSE